MAGTTEIEWADKTINFFWGCTKVSEGCEKCYMFRNSRMYGKSYSFHPLILENQVKKLKSWKEPAVIFVNSMSDTFHEDATIKQIEEIFDIMKSFPQHQFIVLTKRINKAYNYFKTHTCPDNVWLGTSIENKGALHRLVTLKKIQTKFRFVSFEPLLADIGPVDLEGIHWAIVGGESDFSKPRPFDEEWARNILRSCRKYNTAFFYKQSGGKKKINAVWGTNVLDGRTYLEMPVALKTKESTQYHANKLIQTELLHG